MAYNLFNSEKEHFGYCEYCKVFDELRPYGQHGEWICLDCGMKPEHKTLTIKHISAEMNSDKVTQN